MTLARTVPLLALALAACDPVGSMSFQLVEPGGKAVDGATVTMVCPSYAAPMKETTGPDGVWRYQHIPDIDPACTITVEKAGFSTRTVTRAEAGYQKGISDAPPPKVVFARSL